MKNKRKKKILKLAKGFRNARSTKYKQAKQAVIRAGQHAFAHRRKKKRVMRKEWQIKIGAAVQHLQGISYSRFIDMLTKKEIGIDRKIMADLIQNNPETFARFVEEVTGEKNTGELPKAIVVKAKKVDEKTAPKKEKKTEDKEVVTEETEAPKKAEVKETAEKTSGSDDLTKVEGIGPKIASTLVEAGVDTFAKLADTTSDKIQEIITDVRGSHVSDTWPKQAGMAAAGSWDELKAWQDEMDGGKA